MSANLDSTSIEYEAVKGSVEDIKTRSEGIGNLLEEFRTSMGKIYQPDVFEGQASDAFEEKYEELQKKFDDYQNLIKEFAEVVEKAKEQTEDTENRIKQSAEKLDS